MMPPYGETAVVLWDTLDRGMNGTAAGSFVGERHVADIDHITYTWRKLYHTPSQAGTHGIDVVYKTHTHTHTRAHACAHTHPTHRLHIHGRWMQSCIRVSV